MINGILEMLIKRSRTAPEPPGPSIPTDYVFYAPLSNDVNDHSASARTGTIDGTDAGSVIIGDVKDDVKCTYLPQSVRLLYPLEDVGIGGSPRTFSIWVYPSNTKWDTNTFMAVGTAAANKVFAYGCKNYKYNFTAYANDINTNTSVTLAWHNLVVTYSGTMVVIYLDGVEIGSKSTSSIDTGSSDISIGGRPAYNAGEQCENAWFAAARIYNRVLDEDEIALLANEDLTGDTSDSSSSGWSDSSSSGGADPSDSSSSTGGIPTDYDWYTPFTTDYTEVRSGIAGVPTSSGICEIVADSRFGGYLDMHKTSSVKLTGLQFDGTQNALAYGTGPFAMSFWLNAPSWNSYGQAVISHRGDGTGFDRKNGFVIFKDSSYTMDIRIGASSSQCKSFSVQTNDTWHHCLYMRNSDGTWGWYEDGVLKTSGSGFSTGHDATNNANMNVLIGGDGDWGKPAVFKLCRLRIYGRSLTGDEITALANEF